jgi:hypothetical protein
MMYADLGYIAEDAILGLLLSQGRHDVRRGEAQPSFDTVEAIGQVSGALALSLPSSEWRFRLTSYRQPPEMAKCPTPSWRPHTALLLTQIKPYRVILDLEPVSQELSLEVGDGANRKAGISSGCPSLYFSS